MWEKHCYCLKVIGDTESLSPQRVTLTVLPCLRSRSKGREPKGRRAKVGQVGYTKTSAPEQRALN